MTAKREQRMNVHGISLKRVESGPEHGWYAKRPWGWVFLSTSRYAARKIAALGFDPTMPINDPRQPLGTGPSPTHTVRSA